jgi:hypothetical protein
VKRPSQTEIKQQIKFYSEQAKKQEENGYFDTVWHDRLPQLKAMLKTKKGGTEEKPRDIQAELQTSEYGDE